MFKTFSTDNFHDICDLLTSGDPDLAAIIKEHGYPPMWTRPNSFETLVHIILEQQVSLASALAALVKLKEKTKGTLTPASILALSDEELRACYVSRQKNIYIRSLARAIETKHLNLSTLEKMPDEEVRSKLTEIKGIGNWTVDIYLMFVLQRTDIFPLGDLAAVNALKRAKNLPKDTARENLPEIIGAWKPFLTVATMILWHHYLSAPIKKSK